MSNKTEKNRYVATCRMLLLVSACLMPLAHTAYAEPDQAHTKQVARIADALQLSDEQRQQLKQIHRGKRHEAMQLRDAMQDNREALGKLRPSASNYEEQLVKLADEKAQLVKRKVVQEGKIRAKFYAILTPEQREKAAEMKKQHPRKHRRDGEHKFRPS